jgi:hypothetical protein
VCMNIYCSLRWYGPYLLTCLPCKNGAWVHSSCLSRKRTGANEVIFLVRICFS